MSKCTKIQYFNNKIQSICSSSYKGRDNLFNHTYSTYEAITPLSIVANKSKSQVAGLQSTRHSTPTDSITPMCWKPN